MDSPTLISPVPNQIWKSTNATFGNEEIKAKLKGGEKHEVQTNHADSVPVGHCGCGCKRHADDSQRVTPKSRRWKLYSWLVAIMDS